MSRPLRTNSGEWLNRPVSPNDYKKRAISPIPDRRPVQHKWKKQEEVIFDDEVVEDDDVEEERMVIIQDPRARSPSRASIMSQTPSFYHMPQNSPQEFKIVKEGWLFRKTVMQQWKPVYAVAKHGNAVKPGGLYLYKDIKCTSHIQTYDMSEVLEISPRSKDYKQGIKWEILMRVKRDNVILGTDDMQSRKDWIDSLTSIMGKVSIATQNELTNRIQSSEQMNRDLQELAEDLDQENNMLKDQIQSLKDTLAKKDKLHQQELQNQENELKEVFAKKERSLQQEFEQKQDDLAGEMDRQRKALETKCDILEREATQWRIKFTDFEKKHSSIDGNGKIEALEIEIRKWKNRVDELEHQQKHDYRNKPRTTTTTTSSSATMDTNSEGVQELMTDVKFNLQLLKDQLKSPSEDIKTSIDKLHDSLESAKLGWTELQGDIIKFLENEKQELDSNSTKQKTTVEVLRTEFSDLRLELFGVEEEQSKSPSLSEKFDILLQMIESVQISQSRLSTSILENTPSSVSSDESVPSTPTDNESDLYKVVLAQQKQLSEWIDEYRENHQSIESNLRHNRSLPPVPSSLEKLTKLIEGAMEDIQANQQQSHEEQAKQIKAIGNLLKLISADIQASSIPDLAALSEQLEDVVERLNSTEDRLSRLNWTPNNISSNNQELRHMNLSDDELKHSQLSNFIQNTERLMDRTLQVLNRHEGVEESVRRAIKSVSKTQLDEIMNIQDQNKEERTNMEKKMQRYEENAKIYFEKSMERVHSDLHEFSGVMYEMLKELVLQALEHSPNQDNVPVDNIVELYGKLSGLNLALKTEIKRLEEEKAGLEVTVKKMQKLNKDLERETNQRHEELRSLKSEYDRMHKDIQRVREESTHNLARELEPLIHQITKLKSMVNDNDRSKNIPSRYSDYQQEESSEEDNRLRFPSLARNRRGSFTSQTSEDQKSPLTGIRSRLKSPQGRK